jgi:hypothetical protein
MTAPYTEFLRSLKPTDSEAERLAKLLRAYGMHKQRGGFVRVRKDGDPTALYRRIFGVETRRKQDDGEFEDEEIAADETVEGDAPADGSGNDRHHVDRLADLVLQASDGSLTKPEVLNWLLRTPRGNQLVSRMRGTAKREVTPMNREQELASIAKQDGGIQAICEHVIKRAGSSNITQDELVKLFSDTVPRRSGESAAQAFSRAYSANDDEGLLMRKAVQAAKGFSTAGPVREAVAGGTAYDALMAKASEYRKAHPEMTLTREQSFAKVFSDPANRALAARERSENRPTAA